MDFLVIAGSVGIVVVFFKKILYPCNCGCCQKRYCKKFLKRANYISEKIGMSYSIGKFLKKILEYGSRVQGQQKSSK